MRRLLLREKAVPRAERERGAARLVALCRDLAVQLWISEDVETARAVGAAGVHLSEASPSPLSILERHRSLRLGLSLHDGSPRRQAEIECCEHVFLSPILTSQKPGAVPLGVDGFLRRSARWPVPAYALGGVTSKEVPALLRAGVRRLAGIRLFFDPEREGLLRLREVSSSL